MLESQKKNGGAYLTPLGRDRRTRPRYSFTAEVEALDAQSRSRMTARTCDISSGGCYIDTFCPFPRNANVKIRILRDKESFEAHAKVAFSKIGQGMGLCFTSLLPEHQRTLDRLIRELSGEAPLRFEPETAAAAHPAGESELSHVVGELIVTLLRKGALSATEGTALLQRLTTPR